MPDPSFAPQRRDHADEGFLPQILRFVRCQCPGPQFDEQKLLKICNKVVFRRTIPIPQTFHVFSVKGEEFQGASISWARSIDSPSFRSNLPKISLLSSETERI